MMATADASTLAASPKRKPFYRDLSLQVMFGMALGIAFGALWPSLGQAMKPLGDAFISSSRW